jgi:hypothetical protein
MKLSDLRSLYKDACLAMRLEPEPGEFEMWKRALVDREERDLRNALFEWWKSEGGRYMPKPADLIPIADRYARIRRKVATPEFCKNSALGYVGKLVNKEIIRVRCNCAECVLARAQRSETGKRGGTVPRTEVAQEESENCSLHSVLIATIN